MLTDLSDKMISFESSKTVFLSLFFFPTVVVFAVYFLCACTPREDNRIVILDTSVSEVSYDADEDQDLVNPVSIRIATFNVHRFFDTVCDSGDCNYGDYEEQFSEDEFKAKTQQIAQGIQSLDANIVLLQEIEKQVCLDSLLEELGEEKYPVSVMGEIGYSASVDVAVISGGSQLAVIKHRHIQLDHPDGGTTSFAREFLEVHLEFDNRRVIVFVAHFRSKVRDDAGRRLAEARAAYDIILQVAQNYPDALIVFGGDLNDYPGSFPLEELENSGRLYRVASELSDDLAATYEYNDNAIAIDHLFIALDGAGQYVEGSVEVIGQPYGLAGSDHSALVADFLMP